MLPRMMKRPPAAMTSTCMMLVVNSIPLIKPPMALKYSRRAALYFSLAATNLSSSAFSLAKALAVRMPDMPLSMAEFISAVLRLTSRLALFILTRRESVKAIRSGSVTASTRASRHSIVNMTASAPTIVRQEIRMSSGPWCASSVISKRSLVMRLMSAPVRLWSKKLKESFCMWLKAARRMSAST